MSFRLWMLLCCFWMVPLGTAAPAPAAEKPNILMIISDDQAWWDYGFMGHEHIQTPHIDKLAAQSLTFTRGYVPDSLCRPSLASMITGLYPHEHGIVGNDPRPKSKENREAMIKNIEQHPTLPRLLAKEGYLSLQTGKWWEGAPSRGGFTHGMTRGFPQKGGRHGDDGLKIGRNGLKPITDFLDEAKKQDKPFFIWYAPFLPHTPHNPPKRLLNKYKAKAPSVPIAKYWAMCDWFDETCGQLLKILDDRKLAENTVVLYVCDNGWINQKKASRYAPRSKRSQYDGGLRTPIMVRWPGKVKPRMDKTTPVSSIDLAPTALAAVGMKAPEAMSGVNLLDEQAVSNRERIFGEVFAHDVLDLNDPSATLKWRWVIEGRYKLIVPNPKTRPKDPVELFDVIADPHEKKNLAAEKPQKVQTMTQALNNWWKP
ncbi:MAG: sulfatase [Phycisphaeraceae bacterium]|nr:sulfatase [Phycisphaeraceae bacterium]